MMTIRKTLCSSLLATLGLASVVSAVSAHSLVITEVMSSNKGIVQDEDGDASDWVEVFNAGKEPIALKDYCLTDDPKQLEKWNFPDRNLASGEFLVVFASGKDRNEAIQPHTNFKLGAKGEYLGLVKSTKLVQAFEPSLPKLGMNQSFGVVFRGGQAEMAISGALLEPTPGRPNTDQWALPQVKDTKFSVDRGFYDEPFEVTITSATPGARIRYTLDGSAPGEKNGEIYAGPLTISSTTNLRAIAEAESLAPSDVDTHTYIFAKEVLKQPRQPEGWPRTRPGGGGRGFFGFGGGGGGNVPMDYAMVSASEIDATEEEVIEALKAIPSLSIVTEQAHLLDRKSGIYANPGRRGRTWERPISIELIDPTGEEKGFHWNAGLRIRGGHSRSPYCAKHAFRVYFRDDYGDGKLTYPLFGSEGVDEFDDVDLRTAQNYSYHYSDDGSQNTMVREVFSRDSQRAFGQPYAKSRYYHLYLNGLYWGLYQSQEHTEASFGAHYFGGDEEDYDTMKASRTGDMATDGNDDAWRHLYEMAEAIAEEEDLNERLRLYRDLQGLDATGALDPSKTVYLDEQNLIDYMLIIFFTGNFDAPISRFMGDRSTNNWFSIFKRDGRQGFQFFCHDSEHSLASDQGDRINRVGPFSAGSNYRASNPQWIHQQLMASEDYRNAFQERAEWALLGEDGPLTYEACVKRVNRRAETVRKAIVAECARWGDYKDQPSYTKSDWEGAIERLKDVFPVRIELVPEQLRQAHRFAGKGLEAAPLFNPVPIPVMHWSGDVKERGFFRLSEGDAVHYTTDGSDPKAHASPLTAKPSQTRSTPLLRAGQMIRAFVPEDNTLLDTWTKLDFDDSEWRAGIGGAGYDGRQDYRALLGVDLSQEMAGKFPALLTRSLFKWDGESVGRLVLKMKFEDGFRAYLNGEEVAYYNARNGRGLVVSSRGQHMDSEAMQWKLFDITKHLLVLQKGENVLAIHGMNDRVSSSDMLVYPELVALREMSGTEVVVPVGTRQLRSRALMAGAWGPMSVVPIVIEGEGGAAAVKEGNVVISEIMYNPGEPTPEEIADGFEDADEFEFIEVMNISEAAVSLEGAAFTKGIAFDFPKSASLKAGERGVLVKNRGPFEKRYGSKAKVLGIYDGSLKNSGEKVTLSDAEEDDIVGVSFKDSTPWPQSADGLGFSIVLKAPETNPSANQAGNWQASSAVGGSPGAGDAVTASGVVINEILTHTDLPDVDAIELYNPTDKEVDVSGWFLTDKKETPKKYTIVVGSKVAAGGYLVINGDIDDVPENNATLPADRFARSFSLSSHGEEIYLFAADASGNATGYTHGFDFKASQNGVSFGRHINSAGKEGFPPQSRVTLGTANAGPRKALVVISEIMYHPGENDEDEEGEFVEVWNWSTQSVPLFDPLNPNNTWELDGVKFNFPKTQTLKPGEVAMIAKLDPDTFRQRFKVPATVKVFGPLEGSLSNKGERLRLLRPDLPDQDLESGETVVPMLQVDSVKFNDRDPWTKDADGGGVSLERKADAPYSDDPEAWKASEKDGGTPGVAPSRS